MKIFALGPAGTNGHEAAKIILPLLTAQSPGELASDIDFCSQNVEILEKASKQNGVGIVPIENSSAGLVSEVLKGFWLLQTGAVTLYVIGEVELPIEHHLLVHPSVEDVGQLTSVLSHPQALAQCAKSLSKLGLNTRTPATSTAGAAERVSADPSLRTTGALASKFAAEIYGLRVLHANVEDFANNATRFHVVAPEPVIPTGKDRTALIFWVPNRPRALLNLLWCISMEDVNMSSIHSIPLGTPGEYAFYCEFDCHRDDEAGRKVFQRLHSVTEQLLVLGSFPQNTPHKKEV